MRIAVIGNMNNNGFSIMRYFRDLGADAYLLPFANDGVGSLAHFAPAADTWQMPQWASYIHHLEVANNHTAIVGDLKRFRLRPSQNDLKRQLNGYECFVGSGIAPAVLGRIGRSLDLFYPYAAGIEHVGTHELIRSMRKSMVARPFLQYVRKVQIDGIVRTGHCLNAEMSITKQTFEQIGKNFHNLAIPMVYNREVAIDAAMPDELRKLQASLAKYEFTVFNHSRLMWVADPSFSNAEWEECSKHSDWLLRGFAEFVRTHPRANAALVLVEYGPDVEATKRLCRELSIEKSVIWLPKMPRKAIMYLLGKCDVGVGEFYTSHGTIWGGTGWEVLSAGRPLLQSFNFTEADFLTTFGHSPPPILDVKSSADVATRLIEMFRDTELRIRIGQESKAWFDEHNGIGLAEKWLHLLRACRKELKQAEGCSTLVKRSLRAA